MPTLRIYGEVHRMCQKALAKRVVKKQYLVRFLVRRESGILHDSHTFSLQITAKQNIRWTMFREDRYMSEIQVKQAVQIFFKPLPLAHRRKM